MISEALPGPGTSSSSSSASSVQLQRPAAAALRCAHPGPGIPRRRRRPQRSCGEARGQVCADSPRAAGLSPGRPRRRTAASLRAAERFAMSGEPPGAGEGCGETGAWGRERPTKRRESRQNTGGKGLRWPEVGLALGKRGRGLRHLLQQPGCARPGRCEEALECVRGSSRDDSVVSVGATGEGRGQRSERGGAGPEKKGVSRRCLDTACGRVGTAQ